MDFIVHETLYDYGLIFSYEWALDYWVTYWSIFIAFSVIVALVYWLGSRKTVGDLKFAAVLCASVNLLMLGGLQDILFFVLWGNGMPNTGIVWWWSPWIYIFGTWNSNMQLALSFITVILTTFCWSLLTFSQLRAHTFLNKKTRA